MRIGVIYIGTLTLPIVPEKSAFSQNIKHNIRMMANYEKRMILGTTRADCVPPFLGRFAIMASTNELSAGELLNLAKDGDDAALGQLLVHYRQYLKLLARLQIGRRLQGKFDASDVVQETCLGACRDFAAFQGSTENEFSSWLRQILVHVLANIIRRYQKTRRRDVRLERQLTVELGQSSAAFDRVILATQSTPSQQAARKEIGALLANILESLPIEEGELILLRHFEGLTFPEIASRMGQTLDRVKKLWPRALTNLRQRVKENWNECEESDIAN